MIHRIPLPKGGNSQDPSKIIVHAMGELINTGKKILPAADFLKEIGLSAHVLVCPNGDLIKCREDNQGAYHAKNYNKDSLGIEFLVKGVHDYTSFVAAIKTNYLTKSQLESGIKQCQWWVINHSIKKVARHSDLDPSRKVDPGIGFPWDKFKKEVIGDGMA